MKRTIRRVPKKPDDSSSKLVLREIIGLTATDGNGLASSSSSSSCVYVAGCVAVVFDAELGRQSHLAVSHRAPRPLSCVAVSEDGRFVAAGESGTQPAVLVWDSTSLTLISELKGHVYGIRCITFSPDGTQLVSVGGYIHLWEWRSGTLSAKLKASSSCSAVSSVRFSSDAKFVVTSGKKHLKFWVVGRSPITRSNKGVKSLAMLGRAADLGIQKESTFISTAFTLACGQSSDMFSLYALTEAGVLCLIHSGLSIRKSIDLKVEKGFALSVSNKVIACACSNGIVQLFTTETLKHAGSLLYTKDKKVREKLDTVSHAKDGENDFQCSSSLPDAVACQFMMSEKLVVIYGDHSLYIWNVQDINQATRCCVLLAHSACIWDIKNLCCDNLHDQSLACVARGCSGGVSFATCSDDGTIRLWDLLLKPASSEDFGDQHSTRSQSISSTSLASTGTFERDSMELDFKTRRFRSMAVSPDGKYLAAGDSKGSLHIYDLNNFDYICLQDAHDSEILSLSFGLTRKNCVDSKEIKSEHYFLASGGRDQLINLYDSKRNFDLVESIDDHSAAVTSVKLSSDGSKILSCSANRSLVFRDVSITNESFEISHHIHQTASQGTVYDMVVDSKMEIAVTVGQDKKISTFDIASGKLIRSFKQNKDFGDPIKVVMDPSCSYLVCSYSNKSLCLYDYTTGEMVSQAMGHGELITGVIFLPDCKHIVSVGGDGCIFVWQLPALLSNTMQQRIQEMYSPLSPKSLVQPRSHHPIIPSEEQLSRWPLENIESVEPENNQQPRDFQKTLEYKFSVSRLPKWAQGKVTGSDELDLASTQEVELQQGDARRSCSPEAQIRYEHGININEACHSGSSASSSHDCGSPISQRTSSFALDKRWNSIYTVCLSNSPQVQNWKDTNMHVSSQNLLRGGTEIQKNYDHGSALASQTVDGYLSNSKSICKRTDRCDSSNVNECRQCHETAFGNVLDEEEPVHNFRATTDTFDTNYEESDLFKKHFRSLSSTHKIERENPSKRRRYSARFTVQQDYAGSFKGLFDSPSKHLNGNALNRVEKTLDDPSLLVPDEQQTTDTGKQGPVGAGEQKQLASDTSKVAGKIVSYREALLALDAAADNAARLFSELQTSGFREETSSEHGSRLYAKASRLIPSVLEKLKAVSESIQMQPLKLYIKHVEVDNEALNS